MTQTEIDHNLLEDLNGDTSGVTVHLFAYEGATVANQHWQVAFHEETGRGGIVFCGSGSSGHTAWTDAATPEEVLRRYLAGEMLE